jgi:hypothetical protein
MERDKFDPKLRTFFIKNEKLLFDEDEEIEYKNYVNLTTLTNDLSEILKKAICGFLNNKGGRIYLGVSDDKIVKGNYLTDKEQDVVKNYLVNLTSAFYPRCKRDKIRIDYIPVKENEEFIFNTFVVKVIVKQGDVNKLYSMNNKSYQSTIRASGMVINLECEEIEKEILKRRDYPRALIDDITFDDQIPIKPVYKEIEVVSENNNFYIKVNPFLEPPLIRKSEALNKENERFVKILVNGLPLETSFEEMDILFKDYKLYGPIMLENRSFSKNSIAIVTVYSLDEAIRAEKKLNGIIFKNKKLNIKIK